MSKALILSKKKNPEEYHSDNLIKGIDLVGLSDASLKAKKPFITPTKATFSPGKTIKLTPKSLKSNSVSKIQTLKKVVIKKTSLPQGLSHNHTKAIKKIKALIEKSKEEGSTNCFPSSKKCYNPYCGTTSEYLCYYPTWAKKRPDRILFCEPCFNALDLSFVYCKSCQLETEQCICSKYPKDPITGKSIIVTPIFIMHQEIMEYGEETIFWKDTQRIFCRYCNTNCPKEYKTIKLSGECNACLNDIKRIKDSNISFW